MVSLVFAAAAVSVVMAVDASVLAVLSAVALVLVSHR